MLIKVDSREQKVIPLFVNCNHKYEVIGNMHIGDYAICYEDKLLHVVERKTMSDLVASLKGNNLHIETMLKIREETGCQLSYLIESKRVFFDKDTTVKNIPFKNLDSLLNTIYLEHNIPIIYTKDKMGTVDKLSSFCDSYTKLIAKGKIFNVKGGLAPLTTKVIKTTEQLLFNMWLSLPSVGANTAAILLKNYSFKEFLDADINEIRQLKIDNRCVGNRLDNMITKYQGDTCEIHTKLLLSINGVSEARLNRIFAAFTFRQLFTEDLSGITVNGKKITTITNRVKEMLTFKVLTKS